MKKIAVVLISIFVLGLILSSCVPSLPCFGPPKSVLIDDTHYNSYDFDGYGGAAFFATMITMLQSMGYTVAFTSSDGFNPENYGILILPAPVNNYTTAEMQKIANFLSLMNRKLIVLGEWYSYYDSTVLNDLLSYLGSGISFNDVTVYDTVNNYDSDSMWPTVSDFASHPITAGLSIIAFFATTSINTTAGAIALAFASGSAYESAPSLISNSPLGVSGAESEEKVTISTTINVLAAETLKKGKVVAVGDVTLFIDDVYNYLASGNFIDVHDNDKLLTNIINW
ncbi:hypothetical protein [Kosmotoga pacifica]|uniref:Uncharacterized protein n=1 Tax=Kosmotoga pacifica TaxID=1330330 RepID=A0A0G2Z685_9BACT|nr:hypothetical protein [Kosmotoga pacifica]AKI97057.1 hypothetical protein IX53_03580 [Kosmotoga pacifica]